MDSWFQVARDFAQEAAKKSQEIAKEAAKLSQEIAVETAKKSKEIAVEATKKADQIKIEASKRADQFKSLAGDISPSITKKSVSSPSATPEDLEKYGVTDELREFVKGLTLDTFKDFPLDNSVLEENREPKASPKSNVRQDLTKWQEKHALIVLSTVPEISRFRYILCPKHMKESKFWKIYFMLVKSHVTPYEMHAMQQLKAAAAEQGRSTRLQDSVGTVSSEVELVASNSSTKGKTVSAAENDIDAFLLGDLGSSDGEDGGDDGGYDEDFDKFVNSTALESDDEDEKKDKSKESEKMATKAIASDGSSDGELVEMPAEH